MMHSHYIDNFNSTQFYIGTLDYLYLGHVIDNHLVDKFATDNIAIDSSVSHFTYNFAIQLAIPAASPNPHAPHFIALSNGERGADKRTHSR